MNQLDRNGLTEEEFLQAYSKKNYPRPYLTADVVAIAEAEQKNYVLLVRRGQHPFLDRWALPGGFAKQNESIEQSALRELEEETGVQNVQLIPVGIFSQPGRDPRGWVVSQAYVAHFKMNDVSVHAGDDAADVKWFHIVLEQEKGRLQLISDMEHINIPLRWENGFFCSEKVTDLAFDHSDILLQALQTQKAAMKALFD